MYYSEGAIIKAAIKKSGYSVTLVAKHLKISRNTMYNLFTKPYVKDEIVIKLRSLIKDELLSELNYIKGLKKTTTVDKSQIKIEKKYISALEKYNELLHYLVILTNENNLHTFKKIIEDFITDSKI
jgi:predicted transcriptional regulator